MMVFIAILQFILILMLYVITIRAFMMLMDFIGRVIGLKWLIGKCLDRFSNQ